MSSIESIFIIDSGEDYFNKMRQLIDGAQGEILLEVYIFSADSIGNAIVQSLRGAVKRGVRVRLMIDGVGSFEFRTSWVELLQDSGVEIKVYHPFWQLGRLNKRNHRKVIVVDRNQALLGSSNIGEDYLHWRDLSVLVSTKDVAVLAEAFEHEWNRFKKAPSRDSKIFRLNNTASRRKNWYQNWLQDIECAERRLWIASAYFIPRQALIRKIIKTAKRGVDVRLIVPQVSDVPVLRLLTRVYLYSLMAFGVRVFQYRNRVFHAKYAVVDDRASVGSTNLNHRSFLHDQEVEFTCDHASFTGDIARIYEKDVTQSDEISLNDLTESSVFIRLISKILYFFRNYF